MMKVRSTVCSKLSIHTLQKKADRVNSRSAFLVWMINSLIPGTLFSYEATQQLIYYASK